jgi:hypothetical protein
MEKQLAIFPVEGSNDFTIWLGLPEENREKIESLFAKILIKYFHSLSKEVKEHEK